MNDSRPISDDAMRQMLSRLADGDGDAAMASQGSTQWQHDGELRATWHSYQLMGDALRSQDLASTPQRDADFLAQLRARLALDAGQDAAAPATFAPTAAATATVVPMPARPAARAPARWLAPAAIAAGFVAVAGVLVVTRTAAPGGEPAAGAQLAVQSTLQPAAPGFQRAGVGAASQTAGVDLMDAAMVRDAQIDRYFRAHRDMRVGPGAALPGGALRSVDTIVPSR